MSLTDILQENDRYLRKLKKVYTETFDQFCKNLCATDLLDKDQKQLIRGLIKQWEANKK